MGNVVNITGNTESRVVSSRDMAKLLGKQHNNVITLVRKLASRGDITGDTPSVQYTHPQNGRQYTYLSLTVPQALVVTDYMSHGATEILRAHLGLPLIKEVPPVAVQKETTILALVDPNVASMTSEEISELVGSRHNNVKVSIERLLDRGVIQHAAMQQVKNTLGQTVEQYVFSGPQGKRDSIIVVAQLSPEFTARLVDRWQELEAEVAKPVANLSDAASLRGLLLGYTEQVLQLEHKITEDKPKVEFYDNVAVAVGTQTVQDVAKEFGMGSTKFYKLLRDEKILMGHPNQNVPYQKHMDAKHFEVVVGEWKVQETGEVKLKPRSFVTAKGLIYLERRLNKLGHFRNTQAAA